MEEQQGNSSSSSSSSIDSNSHPALSTATSFTQVSSRDLSTDLRLGLSLSTFASQDSPSYSREILPDWPPIKPVLRSALAERGGHKSHQNEGSLFVKVSMEGIPIGRKLDLCMHDSYQSLIKALRCMFRATIIGSAGPGLDLVPSSSAHVLTYEDKEGDWMMVGDVPWDFFLATVRKLKITRFDKC